MNNSIHIQAGNGEWKDAILTNGYIDTDFDKLFLHNFGRTATIGSVWLTVNGTL